MTACRADRQVNARRRPRCAQLPASGTRKAVRRVTIVALISSAGILQQHAQGRFSRANSFRERSMQFEKQSSGGRSPFALGRRRNKASRYPIYLTTEVSTLRSSSEDDAPRPSTVAAAARLMVKAAAGFAAWAGVAFPNFLLTVVSWTFAQALAGCAAYGEAMYPGFLGVGEPVDQRDPVRGTQSEHGNPNHLQSRTSGLNEISPIAKDEIGGSRPILLSRQTPSSAAIVVEAEYTDRSEETPAASASWNASVTSFLARFQSGKRRGRARRPAIGELRAFDDRALNDIGISRNDIEYVEYPANRGDRCA
jgi:uncharacterized protein YjiS (DUF1127 family)